MSKLIEISGQRFITDLLYAGPNNLFERPIYQELGITKALLHEDACPFLQKLDQELLQRNLYLVIYDAWRPLVAQQAMWDILPDDRYVASPRSGSKHNRGTAIDCYLLDDNKKPLVFPTTIDAYFPGCAADLPKWLKYLADAHHGIGLPDREKECHNRDLLLEIMTKSGFLPISTEWWHYELPNAADYPIIPA
jgi:D-alanyl-D-alanine dipeptidase